MLEVLAYEVPRIHVGDWVNSFVNWLTRNFEPFFNVVSTVLSWLTSHLERLLQWPLPIIVAVILAAIGWRARSLAFGIFVLLAFTLIDSMRLWDDAMVTLAQVLVASLVAVVLGLPAGIAAARSSRVSAVVRPILDFMQTMPAFVYLIPAVFFFAIGEVPGVVATVVFAMPPAVRLTELGIRQVDAEVVEAGEAFGAAPRQILTKIQIPLAMPTIMAGVNQVIMLALSMVVIAGLVGAGGLGADVVRSISRLDIGLGFEGGLAVVILAIFLDRVTASFGARSQTRTRSLARD